MAIKMRHNNNKSAVCSGCGNSKDKSLEMYDICIGKTVLTICDACNEQIFNKCLKAEVEKNGRPKDARDMRIVRERNEKIKRAEK